MKKYKLNNQEVAFDWRRTNEGIEINYAGKKRVFQVQKQGVSQFHLVESESLQQTKVLGVSLGEGK
jgi:hypothetical protein